MNWTAYVIERQRSGAAEGHVLVSAEPPLDEQAVRAPLLLNLVLDRSGSMKGAPLAAAIEAAQQLVEDATSEDFLGLCVFDAAAEQLLPIAAMTPQLKDRFHEVLSVIEAGSGTALHAAVKLAAQEANRLLVPGRKPRLLLLTDGEPSVGPEQTSDFQSLGREVAQSGTRLHALGLAGHYLPEILSALTVPSGNGFVHADGPDGLPVAMGSIFSWLHGEVATDAGVRIIPHGFKALVCRHAYPTQVEGDALSVKLGALCAGQPRRVLFTGEVDRADWSLDLTGSCLERGDQRHQAIAVSRVWPDSAEGRLIVGIGHELDLVQAETASWAALARKDKLRAAALLDVAEMRLRDLVVIAAPGIPVRRHLDRISELRLAIERGVGDLRLLARRSESASTITRVSQIFPDPRYRN